MRRLILKMHISIDGFVAGMNGESDWIFKTQDAGATEWILDTLRHAGVHIMGRRTFQDMAAYWPSSPGPLAAPMNEIPKMVFSRKGIVASESAGVLTTPLMDAAHAMAAKGLKPLAKPSPNALTWDKAIVAGGDLSTEIARLKQQPGRDILAHGGAKFPQSLTTLGLVDEYRLLVHPVALGPWTFHIFYSVHSARSCAR
jgi:dihydrofolate reductase